MVLAFCRRVSVIPICLSIGGEVYEGANQWIEE